MTFNWSPFSMSGAIVPASFMADANAKVAMGFTDLLGIGPFNRGQCFIVESVPLLLPIIPQNLIYSKVTDSGTKTFLLPMDPNWNTTLSPCD